MEQVQLSDNLSISSIVHGMWRLMDWGFSAKELIKFVEECQALGIDTFDHADIYGDYMVEEEFGKALGSVPSLNKQLKIVTKFGIQLLSGNRPRTYIKHYNTSYDHIIWSAENSLEKLKRENIELLLIHRPDPFNDPSEIARAFTDLKQSGKVSEFGVSNYLPAQFDSLQAHLDFPLVTNQIEVSVTALTAFDNGMIDLCQEVGISPMAWSPLSGGSVFHEESHRFLTIRNALHKISDAHGVTIDQIMYAWILKHPANIIPIVGSGKIERVKRAVDALTIDLTRQQWFELWVASKGENVP